MSRTALRNPTPATRPATPAKQSAPARPTRTATQPARPQTAPPAVRLNKNAPVEAAKNEPGIQGGEPLLPEVRKQIERSLNVDLQSVRVHSDSEANKKAKALSARAFTVGNHIFLAQGERPSDLPLIAHEAAHVVQQQSAPALQKWSSPQTDSFEHEAHQAASAISSGSSFSVQSRTSANRIQRLGIGDALDYFADKANNIPGFRLFTIILGVNPINMSSVQRSAANILRALVEFLPGGGLIVQALDNYGIFDKIGNWVEQQISSLGLVGSSIKQAIMDFLDSLSWKDIFRLGSVWDRAKRIFTEPIDRIINFAKGLVTDIIKFIKDAILRPLAKLAEGTAGYDLLKAVLGQDPITGDPVPQNADTLIGGFMKLIGQEEIWNNLKKANAVARAWAWFQGAMSGLMGFVRQIPSLFIQALQSLELADIVLLPRAFVKVGTVFASFFGQFVSWAGQQVLSLLQIIFEVVAPGAVPYIQKAAGAFNKIIENPIGFIGNLVKAGILGFKQFAGNFLSHLKTSLINWLTGTMSGAGVYIPQGFNLQEIIKFVLSVLGLTWQNIRQKLVKAVGETAVKVLETGFDIVVTLVREGPAAAWQKIVDSITNLQSIVMEQIMNFVRDRIVQKAITMLVTSLNPAGAFIQAIIAIYNTIMFFIERLKQIAQVAMSFIDSISAIANGVLAAAANRVEKTMAGLLTLVISFLARLAGLGKVSDAVVNIINKVRAPIDKALDKVVDWIMAQVKRLLAAGKNLAGKVIAWLGIKKSFTTVGGESHTMFFKKQGSGAQFLIRSAEMSLENFLADLATKYAGDKDKLPKVQQAQQLVAAIKSMTAAPNPAVPPAATSSIDAAVQAKVDQLGAILREIGDGVSLDGATAAYRGQHYWVDPKKAPAEDQAEYLAKLTKQVLGAQQLSKAVRVILAQSVPAGRKPTQAEIDAAVTAVRSKMGELKDGTEYEAEGKTYFDRFHFLLGRFVTNLDAFKARLAAAAEIERIEGVITETRTQLGTLASGTDKYYLAKKKLQDLALEKKKVGQVPSAYKDLRPTVQASPFVSTSMDAMLTAQYALGEKYKPSGLEKRTSGVVGLIMIFVASKKELVKDGTYSIDELKAANKIRIRKSFSEKELTFTGDVPGAYLRGQLSVSAGQDAGGVGGNAMGRAAAEASRFGGLK